MPAIIETERLTMEFPSTRALDSLDLAVQSGVTGLVGANGAGKTTLDLARARPPAADGRFVERARSRSGWAGSRTPLADRLRTLNATCFPTTCVRTTIVRHLSEVKGLPRDEARSRASDSLYLVGLGEERFRSLGTMSTGQRQRVKLAQAIAADPRLIVLDEPTDGLDPVQRDEMLNIVVQVNREFGIDVVLSSHVLEEVERVCDNVVALDAGHLIAQGSMAELAGAEGGIEVEFVRDRRPSRR